MDTIIEKIISSTDNIPEEKLDEFLETACSVYNFPELDKNNTREALWESLYRFCKSGNNQVILKCLSAIRILSRDKTYLGKLVSEDWLALLRKLVGFEENSQFTDENINVAIEAEKCLCNMCYNSISVAKLCYNNGMLNSVIERIKNYKNIENDDIRYFDAKLLFLISAVRPELRRLIRTELKGTEYLAQELEGILNDVALPVTKEEVQVTNLCLTDMQVNITCEILKALFNITLHLNDKNEEEVQSFTNIVVIIRKFLLVNTTSCEKRIILQNDVVNLLTNAPHKSYRSLLVPASEGDNLPKSLVFDNMNMTAFYEMLILLKNKFTKQMTVTKQHELLSPILTVLLKSASSDRIIRRYLKSQILPPLTDVHSLPEQGDELRNHLCKLLTTPITEVRDITAEFLFILCKKNVTRMIKYTGYGNAAGLFAQRGLLGGKRDQGQYEFESDDADSETEEYAEYKHGINPVVGRYEEPRPNPMDNMSDEQKEYEALKLVQLIDDLSKCGAIKPCRVGGDGKPEPIEHVLQLQERLKLKNIDSDESD